MKVVIVIFVSTILANQQAFSGGIMGLSVHDVAANMILNLFITQPGVPMKSTKVNPCRMQQYSQ